LYCAWRLHPPLLLEEEIMDTMAGIQMDITIDRIIMTIVAAVIIVMVSE
jgi:hypothetical protein